MINVAVCDDNEYDIRQIQNELEKYSAKKRISFTVNTYSKPEALIYELEDGKIADIFILDVSMPRKDGFELADEIRKYTSTSVILFLTSHEDMATRGYKSKALRYIIKMHLTRDIEEALDCAVAEISDANENTIMLHKYSDYWRVPYNEIIAVNRISRQLIITTNSYGELTDNRGITEFFEALNDSRFLFIDRSCFVNIDYISQISGYNLKLTNGQVLPISRRSLQNVKQSIMKQWSI